MTDPLKEVNLILSKEGCREASTEDFMEKFADKYVLMKRGFIYRPNANGYTDNIREAGLYTKEEAEPHVSPIGEPVTMHLASKYMSTTRDIVPGHIFDEVVKQRDTATHDLSKSKVLAWRLRIALKQVFDRSGMTLTDSGDSGIHAIVSEALNLCESDTIRVSDLPPAVQKFAPAGDSDEVIEVPAEEAGASGPAKPVTADSAAPASGASARLGPSGQKIIQLKDFVREQEQAYLNRALAQTGNDKEKTAQMLGISVATLYRKLSEDAVST